MIKSKSRILLSSLTTLGVLGVGVAGATGLNVGASTDSIPYGFLDVKAEDNISKIDVKDDNVKNVVASPVVSINNDVIPKFHNLTKVIDNVVVDTTSILTEPQVDLEINNIDVENINNDTLIETDVAEDSVNENIVIDDINVIDVNSNNDVTTEVVSEENIVEILDQTIYDTTETEVIDAVNQVHSSELEIKESIIVETITEIPVTHDTTVTENVDVNSIIEQPVTNTVTEEPVTTEQPVTNTVTEEPVTTVIDESQSVVEEQVVQEQSTVVPMYDNNNTYPIGQCTWGVKELAPWVGNYWGNANQWLSSGIAAGHTTGSTPQVGSVAVWTGGYGHVAVVTAVDGDNIQVMEANYGGSAEQADSRGIGNYRGWFSASQSGISGYVYP